MSKYILVFLILAQAVYSVAFAFTDKGNGTVADEKTGLTWQKQDDGHTYNWYVAAGVYNERFNPSKSRRLQESQTGRLFRLETPFQG